MELYNFSFRALGGFCEIQTFNKAWSKAERLALLIEKEVLRIQNKFSNYLDQSIISQINKQSGRSSVEVDEEVVALFDFAEICFKKSCGELDITFGPLKNIWDFSSSVLPSKEEVQSVLPLINFNNLSWSNDSAYLSEIGMEIDLGSISKYYSLEKIKEICIKEQCLNTLINFSGDLLAINTKYDGSPWIVGVAHPRCKKSMVCSRELYAGALMTTGDYDHYFIQNSKRYCNVLSARTGYSPEYFQSTSVFHDSPLIAGSLSQICFLVGKERSELLLNEHKAKYLFIASHDADGIGPIQGNLDNKMKKRVNNKIVNISSYAQNQI